jgi:hypothetical protein
MTQVESKRVESSQIESKRVKSNQIESKRVKSSQIESNRIEVNSNRLDLTGFDWILLALICFDML